MNGNVSSTPRNRVERNRREDNGRLIAAVTEAKVLLAYLHPGHRKRSDRFRVTGRPGRPARGVCYVILYSVQKLLHDPVQIPPIERTRAVEPIFRAEVDLPVPSLHPDALGKDRVQPVSERFSQHPQVKFQRMRSLARRRAPKSLAADAGFAGV